MTTGSNKEITGIISNIQRFTVHDGPGIRTELFLKGCPLKCLWCSNPENLKMEPQVGVVNKNCIGVDKCGWCLKACSPEGNILIVEDNEVVRIDRTKCVNCLACAKACPAGALVIYGTKYTVPEIVKIIMEDHTFYETSNGGVTFSGGDPLVQWEFTLAVLRECRRRSIHTCVESELYCKTEILDEILPFTNLFFTDIKHMNSEKHRKYTGVGNETILENIKYVAKKGTPLVIRMPVVPGYNDDDENIEATARFIKSDLNNGIRQLQLLPYRLLGLEKYESLGMEYPMAGTEPPKSEKYLSGIRKLVEVMKSYGINAAAGTTVKFD